MTFTYVQRYNPYDDKIKENDELLKDSWDMMDDFIKRYPDLKSNLNVFAVWYKGATRISALDFKNHNHFHGGFKILIKDEEFAKKKKQPDL